MAIFTKENTTNRKEYNILGRELQLSSISWYRISVGKYILCCDIMYPNCLFGSLRVGARSTISVIQITSDTQVRSLSAFLFFFSYICFHSKRRLIFMIFKNMINIFFITDEF